MHSQHTAARWPNRSFVLIHGGATSRSLVEHHHFRDERGPVALVHQSELPRDGGEILADIAAVIRLVIVLRECFQYSVVILYIPALQRIEQHKASTRLENAGAFPDGIPARLRRQFVKGENARRRVETVVRRRDRLRVADDEIDARPAAEVAPGMTAVGLR